MQPPNSKLANRSFVLESTQNFRFEDREVPIPQDPHDVLVRIKYTGICGSDVHYWQTGQIGPFKVTKPLVLGHESSGIVEQVGTSVKTLKPGDRVTLEPGVPCRRCEECKGGKYNLCADMAFAATPPFDGTLAKYYMLADDLCYKIPESMSLQQAALVEPLSVAVHLVRQAGVSPGSSIVIFGVGPVGLLVCAVARAFGAAKVIAVDIQQSRLDFAAGYLKGGESAAGVQTFIPDTSASAFDNAARLRDSFNLSPGADVVIDASGAEASINTGIHVLRHGGTYVQGGMGRDEVKFPITAVCTKEINARGSFRYNGGDYKLAIELLDKRKVTVDELISDVVEFEQAEEALKRVKAGDGIKILIEGVKE